MDAMLETLEVAPPTSLDGRLRTLENQVQSLRANAPTDTMCIVVHGGDLEHLCAAFVMANSAAAMGTEVKLFFAFWAAAALRDPNKKSNKSWRDRLMGWMLPTGASAAPLSRMNMGGLGTRMMRRRMKQRGGQDLAGMLQTAREVGVRIDVCQMSLDLLGIQIEELVDYPGLRACGASTFLAESMSARLTLFV